MRLPTANKKPTQELLSWLLGYRKRVLGCRLGATGYRSQNTKSPEVRFCALLSDGTREVRFERVAIGLILCAANWAMHECTNNFPVYGVLGNLHSPSPNFLRTFRLTPSNYCVILDGRRLRSWWILRQRAGQSQVQA